MLNISFILCTGIGAHVILTLFLPSLPTAVPFSVVSMLVTQGLIHRGRPTSHIRHHYILVYMYDLGAHPRDISIL